MTYRLKIQFCTKFSEKYLIVLFFLFVIILGKRIILESMSTETKDYSRIFFHMIIIALSLLALRFQRTQEYTTRFAPHLICLLSFFGHTRYLAFNTFFSVQLKSPFDNLLRGL